MLNAELVEYLFAKLTGEHSVAPDFIVQPSAFSLSFAVGVAQR
jgi:hypothetical protein